MLARRARAITTAFDCHGLLLLSVTTDAVAKLIAVTLCTGTTSTTLALFDFNRREWLSIYTVAEFIAALAWFALSALAAIAFASFNRFERLSSNTVAELIAFLASRA